MKQCPNCGAQIADNCRFCVECGKEQPQGALCPHCGASMNEGDVFCQNCGKKPTGTPIEANETAYEGEVEKKSGLKKYLPCILGAFVLLAIIGYFNSKDCEEVNDNQPVVADSIVVEDTEKNSEKEIQAKKDFIETFYKGMENSNDYDAFVRKHVTPKALKILKDEYEYECDNGDCLATWLFSYEAGSDIGAMVSRTVNMKDENNFLVVTKYEDAEYEVRLSVINYGHSYKIDDIEKVRAEYKVVTVDNTNLSSDDSYSSSNTSSSSRTFQSEQLVIGYLANQSFRASDGLTMRVDGDGRLYVDGDYAGVLSVLRYSSTAALLRYGGGMYGEGKLTVNIVGDKFTLTDPTDGTVYYQR